MEGNKWIGFSRSLWSALLPVVLITMRVFGVADVDQIGETATKVVDSLIVMISAVLQFMHQRNPQPTTLARNADA
jgi:hypothetical protein